MAKRTENSLAEFDRILTEKAEKEAKIKKLTVKKLVALDEECPFPDKWTKVQELLFQHNRLFSRLCHIPYEDIKQVDSDIGQIKKIRRQLQKLK